MEGRKELMDKLDLFINEMNTSEIHKVIKSKDLAKIVSILSDMDDEEIDKVLKIADPKLRKELEKMREGPLL